MAPAPYDPEHDLGRMTPANRTLTENFLSDRAGLIGPHQVRNYCRTLLDLDAFLGKPYPEATAADLRKWCQHLLAKYARSSPLMHTDRAMAYYRFTLGDEADQAKALAKWKREALAAGKGKAAPKAILTPQQVRAIIQAARSERDQLILACLWETGWRIGAIQLLKVGSVRFEQHRGVEVAALTIRYPDQTEERATVINTAPLLKRFLNVHPGRTQPSAPLFLNEKRRYNPKDPASCGISYARLYAMVRRTAEAAGIPHRISAHHFRHGRASDLARRGVHEQVMRKLLGWSDKSDMPTHYAKLTETDVRDHLLRAQGIAVPEQQDDDPIKLGTCPSCQSPTAATDAYCPAKGCGFPLIPSQAEERKQEQAASVLGALQDVLARSSDPQAAALARLLGAASREGATLADVRMDEQRHVKATLTPRAKA